MRVTQAELARYRRRLAGQAQAARAYVLARVERALAPSASVAEVRDATIEAVSDAIGVYGDQAQAVAADLFDEVMEAEGLKPRATVYEGAIDEAVLEEKVHYYADQLAQGRLARYTRDVGDLAAYYVRRSAYECMVANCVGQKVAFARVPTGRETCGWCLMLASRGFTYTTERSAAGGSHEGCDCVIVPGVKGGTEIAGYDPDGLARRWRDCVDTVGGTLSRAETTAMWEALPNEERERLRKRWGSGARERFHVRESTRAARAEAERRDPRWLYRGVEPEITFASPEWESEIRMARPWEIDTAEKLKSHGIACDFWLDYEEYDSGGIVKRTGLPDLANGYELKAIINPKGVSAVNAAMRDAGHKKGIRCCVIDNSRGRLDDDEVVDEIRSHQHGRHVDNVLLLTSDGKMIRLMHE